MLLRRHFPVVVLVATMFLLFGYIASNRKTLAESNADVLQLVGEADSEQSGVRLVQQTKPDVVLMDFRMPGMDGLMATQQNAGGIAAGRPCGGGVGVRVSEHLKEFLFCSLRVTDSQRADVVSRPRLCKD